jgi:hypothetical protein
MALVSVEFNNLHAKSDKPMPDVAMLVFDNCQAAAISAVIEALTVANLHWASDHGNQHPPFAWRVISLARDFMGRPFGSNDFSSGPRLASWTVAWQQPPGGSLGIFAAFIRRSDWRPRRWLDASRAAEPPAIRRLDSVLSRASVDIAN